MEKTRNILVLVFVSVWTAGLAVIIIGGFWKGVQKPDIALEWLESYFTGTTAIITGIVGYYFGAKSKTTKK